MHFRRGHIHAIRLGDRGRPWELENPPTKAKQVTCIERNNLAAKSVLLMSQLRATDSDRGNNLLQKHHISFEKQ